MKSIFYTVLGILFLAGSFYLFLESDLPAGRQGRPVDKLTIHIGERAIKVDVADGPFERDKGLGGRTGLGENEGMLFVFETSAPHGFWMKDMLFPIDMIWIAEDGKIVDIEKSVSPDTYPQVFYPSTPAKYVLEVSSGYTSAHGIDVGQEVSF